MLWKGSTAASCDHSWPTSYNKHHHSAPGIGLSIRRAAEGMLVAGPPDHVSVRRLHTWRSPIWLLLCYSSCGISSSSVHLSLGLCNPGCCIQAYAHPGIQGIQASRHPGYQCEHPASCLANACLASVVWLRVEDRRCKRLEIHHHYQRGGQTVT